MFGRSKKKKNIICVLEKLRNDGFLEEKDLKEVKDELQIELEEEFFSNNIELDQLIGQIRYGENKSKIYIQDVNNLFFKNILFS